MGDAQRPAEGGSIDDVIAAIESGQTVRLHYDGIERELTRDHLDDLYLARWFQQLIAKGAGKLTAAAGEDNTA